MVFGYFGPRIYVKGWVPPLYVNETNPLLYKLTSLIPSYIVQDADPIRQVHVPRRFEEGRELLVVGRSPSGISGSGEAIEETEN